MQQLPHGWWEAPCCAHAVHSGAVQSDRSRFRLKERSGDRRTRLLRYSNMGTCIEASSIGEQVDLFPNKDGEVHPVILHGALQNCDVPPSMPSQLSGLHIILCWNYVQCIRHAEFFAKQIHTKDIITICGTFATTEMESIANEWTCSKSLECNMNLKVCSKDLNVERKRGSVSQSNCLNV